MVLLTAPGRRRHSAVVRITHWATAGSFIALFVSGVAILLAHPRLYWGETGGLGSPSLLDLPLPLVLTGQSGWGRYLHFLSAWICIVAGAAYVVEGAWTARFRHDLFQPAVERRKPKYGHLQRVAYGIVVFGLFPMMIWTGFAMSPALTSVVPAMVTGLGGQQSARTIHFVVANALSVFVIGHVGAVIYTGFTSHVGWMIFGGVEPAGNDS